MLEQLNTFFKKIFSNEETIVFSFAILAFFIIISFACVFIHEVLNYFFNKQLESSSYIKIAYSLAIILAVCSVIYSDRLYTLVCFSLTSVSLFILG